MTEEEVTAMAKAMRLALNEAKTVLVEWGDRYEDEEQKMGFVIIASNRLLMETIDAVLTVDDPTFNAKLMRQIDTLLLPVIDKLRERMATQ